MNKSTEKELTPEEKWERATLANNFLFCKIMSSEPELCKELLELLLEIEIDHLEPPVAEMTMQDTIESKSVRFDVYAKSDGQVFDIEMQTTKKKNLPKRARYYQSIIDADTLRGGMDYRQLKDSYVIFLCLEDFFKKGLPVYKFENLCVDGERTIPLNDRAFKIFFNASKYDKLEGEKQRNFFKFLKGEDAVDDFSKQLEEKVVRAKKNADWRRQYMTWEQELREELDEAREEILAEGERIAHISAATNLLKMRLGTIEQIAEAEQLPIETVRELAESLCVVGENGG